MQNNKYLSMLGLARKAGKLSAGHDASLDSVRSNKAKLIIFSGDVSKNVVKDFEKVPSKVPAVRIKESSYEIEQSIGRRVGVVTLNDANFASRILELIEQEDNAYGNKS